MNCINCEYFSEIINNDFFGCSVNGFILVQLREDIGTKNVFCAMIKKDNEQYKKTCNCL